jgi:hypothetical protein
MLNFYQKLLEFKKKIEELSTDSNEKIKTISKDFLNILNVRIDQNENNNFNIKYLNLVNLFSPGNKWDDENIQNSKDFILEEGALIIKKIIEVKENKIIELDEIKKQMKNSLTNFLTTDKNYEDFSINVDIFEYWKTKIIIEEEKYLTQLVLFLFNLNVSNSSLERNNKILKRLLVPERNRLSLGLINFIMLIKSKKNNEE